MFHLKKIECDFDLTLTTPPKVKSMISSYVPLRTIQLLFETFFGIQFSRILNALSKMGLPVYLFKCVCKFDKEVRIKSNFLHTIFLLIKYSNKYLYKNSIGLLAFKNYLPKTVIKYIILLHKQL